MALKYFFKWIIRLLVHKHRPKRNQESSDMGGRGPGKAMLRLMWMLVSTSIREPGAPEQSFEMAEGFSSRLVAAAFPLYLIRHRLRHELSTKVCYWRLWWVVTELK